MADMATVFGSAIGFTILIAPLIIFFVGPGLLLWLWNLTLPDLFRLPALTYWQAFRIFLIAALLFGLPRLV